MNRTVTARSRCAALSRFASRNPSPPPSIPFFHTNSQHPSPEPSPRSPMASVLPVSNTIHAYSSSTALVYGSHPRPMSAFALLPPSHPYIEEAVQMENRPRPEGMTEVIDMDMDSPYLFLDGARAQRRTEGRRHLPCVQDRAGEIASGVNRGA